MEISESVFIHVPSVLRRAALDPTMAFENTKIVAWRIEIAKSRPGRFLKPARSH
jgi:hypothetical protein